MLLKSNYPYGLCRILIPFIFCLSGVIMLLLLKLIPLKLIWPLTMREYMEWRIILISLLETFSNLHHHWRYCFPICTNCWESLWFLGWHDVPTMNIILKDMACRLHTMNTFLFLILHVSNMWRDFSQRFLYVLNDFILLDQPIDLLILLVLAIHYLIIWMNRKFFRVYQCNIFLLIFYSTIFKSSVYEVLIGSCIHVTWSTEIPLI